VPGAEAPTPCVPVEVVEHRAAVDDHVAVLDDLSRFAALVVGPGLGRTTEAAALVQTLVARADLPLVLDGDGFARFMSDEARGSDWARVVASLPKIRYLTAAAGALRPGSAQGQP
jgi:NAD(P)H-hydrate repair Nnr-like enzyme with NAD(P)H-hydrate dehydratase domain